MPGTMGSLPAVAIFVLIATVVTPEHQSVAIAACFAASCVLSVALGRWAERHWQTKDPRPFVLDEVASFFLTVLLFRVPDLLLTVCWAFVATRFFDIVKPPPANRLESLPGGWGILLDDLVASIYAAAVLHLASSYFPSLFNL